MLLESRVLVIFYVKMFTNKYVLLFYLLATKLCVLPEGLMS